jgi:GrpB-like predicted nucleotidyltransferase (UPF0157 family)
MSDRIVVVDYDPGWPEAFERERDRIAAALGADALAIEHYGSTAVEGIPAKPIIDVMVVVRDLDSAEDEIARLEQAGYERRPAGDLEQPRRLFLVRYDGELRAAHLALIAGGGDYWDEHVTFRDAVRADPALARRYAQLKRDLARRYRDDRIAYTEAKTEFVEEALRKWRGEGLEGGR